MPTNIYYNGKIRKTAYEPDSCFGCKEKPQLFQETVNDIVKKVWLTCGVCGYDSIAKETMWEAIKEWNHMEVMVSDNMLTQ